MIPTDNKEALRELFILLDAEVIEGLLSPVTDIDMIDKTSEYDVMERVYRHTETGVYYGARWIEWNDEDGTEKAEPVHFVPVKPIEVTSIVYEEI